MARTINKAGLDIIKESEDLKLKAYVCPSGRLTIGWGHTGSDVTAGMRITKEKADSLLSYDLREAESAVARHAKVATANQFSAMVSLVFNIGAENFRTSTLLRLHNEGEHEAAAAQFHRWVKAKKGGRYYTLPGLVKRRAKEADLYSKE